MMMGSRRCDPDRELPAHRRFQCGFSARVALGLLAAVALHWGTVRAFPTMEAEKDYSGEEAEQVRLETPPSVEVPPPPSRVARPAEPVVAKTEVAPEATIEPTEFRDEERMRDLPTPPRTQSTAATGDRPSFIPRDVDPRLKNGEELAALLREHYPDALAEAGIDGRVILWVFVDEEGRVAKTQVRQSSGYERLDEAAKEVAREMRFEPAQSQDRAIGVWVSQPVTFTASGS